MSASEQSQSLSEINGVGTVMSRVSATRLQDPGPSDAEIELLLQAGDRAPDHGRLRPWRFTVIKGAARDKLADLLVAQLKQRNPNPSPADIERERAKTMRAPVIIVVAAKLAVAAKIPAIEQVMAVAAATQNMFLVAHALGYGAMWKTGDPAYDDAVKATFGLAPHDHIVAFLYVGTPLLLQPRRAPQTADVTSWF